MKLFNQDDYGKPISEELSEYLKKNTSVRDRGTVSRITGQGTSIIRDVSFGYRSLTEANSVAIIELLKIAIRNLNNDVEDTETIKEVKWVKDNFEELQSA